MSDNQNLPEEDLPILLSSKSGMIIQDDIIDTTSINPTSQSPNMEVHKHPHHVMHKKKWTEYLLEFFMLFLAVFLGFTAENIREGVVESHREKQFMESLVKDLQMDTVYANNSLQAINKRDLSIDSTLNYFIDHPHEAKIPFNTVRQMRRSTWDQVFMEHTGTIDQ